MDEELLEPMEKELWDLYLWKYESDDWPENLLWCQVLEIKPEENKILMFIKTEFGEGFNEEWNLSHFQAGLKRGFYRRIKF